MSIESLGDQGDGIAKVEQGYVVIVPEAQWRVVTQPITIDRPLTRTFYGDELEEWLADRQLMIRPSK